MQLFSTSVHHYLAKFLFPLTLSLSLTLTYSSEHAELSLVLSLQFVDSVCHKPTLGTIVHTRLAPTPNVYLQTLVQNEHVRLVERFNIKSNL